MPARSPIRLAKRRPFGDKGPTYRTWQCDEDRLRMARFQNRRDPDSWALVHRSTKSGTWQVSYFERDTPTGDFQSSSCQLAVRELHHKSWRLDEVISKR